MTNTKGRYASLLGTTKSPSASEASAHAQQPANPPADLPANQQTSTPADQHRDKSANPSAGLSEKQRSDYRTTPPTDNPTNPQNRTAANTPVGKRGKKFTSYLPEEAIRKIKWLAIERGVNDYEIFQEAVEHYLSEQPPSSSP